MLEICSDTNLVALCNGIPEAKKFVGNGQVPALGKRRTSRFSESGGSKMWFFKRLLLLGGVK